MAKAATKKPVIDWDAVEPHYRAGIRSLKDMAAEFGCSDAAIIKHAKAHKWSRNLKAKIQQRAAEKVSAAMVSAEVSALTKVTENLRIEVESEVQSRITLSHRADITRGRKLTMALMEELEMQTGSAEDFEKLGELMAAPDDKGFDKLNELYRKVISTPGRIDSVKKISETLKNLIALEREAFGLDSAKPQTPGDALDNLLSALDGRTASLIPNK